MKEKENISQKEFERIESFILNKLPEERREAFAKELETNADLRKEVDIQRQTMLAVEASGMKNRLDIIHQKLISKGNLNIWVAAAAGVAILITVGFWLINMPGKTDKLFAENVTIDPGLPVPMSATDNYTFYDAMVDYKSGKYDLAIGKWTTLLQLNPENDTLNYYMGAALFNAEKYEQAIPYFEKVSKLNQSTFYGKSEWYMALSFLKLKQFNRLEMLAKESQSNYSDQIKQLNQKLE